MPITPSTSSSIVLVDEHGSRSKFTLAAPPPSRKRRAQRNPVAASQPAHCTSNSPRPSPNRRRSSTCSRVISPRSPLSSFLSVLDPPSATRSTRKGSACQIGLGLPGTRLSPTVVNTILALTSGKSHRRSLSVPCTAWSFETHFEPSPKSVEAPVRLAPSPKPSPPSYITSPVHVLFQRTCALATLGGVPLVPPATPKPKSKSKTRPTPIMANNKNGHVNVLLLPKSRDGGAASVRSNTSASTSASKSKSRKTLEPSSNSSKTTKTPNPALRAQRSLTPARGIANDAFRPLPYATHAALDEFFGDPRKMNALHAHQSSSGQLGARPDEVGYGNSIGHRGADGWIWFDAIEEQEYAWLMGEAEAPNTPGTARQPKEKKSKKRGLFGRRNSVASESSGRSDWESFDALRRGSESGTSDGGIVDPTTYDLDPTLPPRYRTPETGSLATYRVAAFDAGAWDAAVHSHVRKNVGGASVPKTRTGRSKRGGSSKGRPPPLNLAAVTHTLAALGPVAPAAVPSPIATRRQSLPVNCLFPPSLADAARADFVSSSYLPHPSKRDLNLDPETPWSANLPQETIYRSIGTDLAATSPAAGSPFKAMFARRASLTPLPLRHTPAPLPRSGQTYEFKGTGTSGALPKLPPMPMENGAPAPMEGRRKTSLADIFKRSFGRGGRK